MNSNCPTTPWTTFFNAISTYDFADEVNLDVLGHLFERSITELEKLKESGLFGDAEKASRYAAMPQSAKRKQLGIYYTPPELTGRIVQYTVEELIAQRFAAAAVEFGVSEKEAQSGHGPRRRRSTGGDASAILRNLKIVDPACGSGAFLFQAYDVLEARYNEVIGHLDQLGEADAKKLAEQIPTFILQENLYGVDLSPEAVEITQLALWIRSASPGQLLAKLSENIVHGNSLVHDPAVHPAGFDWRERFPDVFNREEAGFDCVIGNPPWERMKLQEREFFRCPPRRSPPPRTRPNGGSLSPSWNPTIRPCTSAIQQALAAADSLLTYCRTSDQYPLTGKGDINTYAVFAELAYRLVAPHGRVGLLVPSGIASDMTTKDFFAAVAESNRLIRLYDFENRLKTFFPEVHASLQVLHPQLWRRTSGSLASRFRLLCSPGRRVGRPEAAHCAQRRRHPAAESQHANVPDLPLAARRGNHQSHLPPRSRLDRREPRGTNRQPVGHPVQDDVPSNERRRIVPRSRRAQGGRFQAERQSVDQGETESFCRFTKRRCFRTTTTARPTL